MILRSVEILAKRKFYEIENVVVEKLTSLQISFQCDLKHEEINLNQEKNRDINRKTQVLSLAKIQILMQKIRAGKLFSLNKKSL